MSTQATVPAAASSSPQAGGRLAPLLVLALDGATFDVIQPLIDAGRLPNLARWMDSGRSQPLPSTRPPMTFPAWSSFMTGLDPGEHGVFDFTQKLPGAYRIRFSNASDRVGKSIFARVSEAGGRVLVLGMPATFPPEPLHGLLVPGFDAPVSSGSDANATSDPDLYREVAERVGPWMRPDLKEGAEEGDFHERAVATLLDRVARKRDFALTALERMSADDRGRPDLMLIVFSESDTVGHHYFRDHDRASPRHDPGASEARLGAIAAVYEALDEACGAIRQAYGEDAACIVVSDHGMGAAARSVVHLNRFLADCGLLARTGNEGLALSRLARLARDAAVRVLPPRLAQLAFRYNRASAARLESAARFGGYDWARTQAFSEEANTQPGVWINLRGREAQGCVSPDDYEAVRDRVIDALTGWRLPCGEPVLASARRREEVYRGAFVDRAPDIVVELGSEQGYGLSLVPTPWEQGGGHPAIRELGDEELAGGRGRGMNGTHRPEGIFIETPGSVDSAHRAAAPLPRQLVELAGVILSSMGIAAELTSPAAPHQTTHETTHQTPERHGYTDEEDALVAERLRAMGYLE